jgi:hypothetical protein
LTVISPRSTAPLWQRLLKNVGPNSTFGCVLAAEWDWPAIVDLNGKGKPQIVVPFVDVEHHVTGVELLDGASGASRWKRPLARIVNKLFPVQTYRVIAGPDLDGDGCRELFAASYNSREGRIDVDALSGADGRILWSNQQIKVFPNQPGVLLPMRWWQPGSDGWPLLVVGHRVGGNLSTSDAAATILAASTGQIEHELTNFGQPEVFDLNGDGLLDLLGVHMPMQEQTGGNGKLRAINGLPSAAWRLMGRDLQRAQDFNHDGYADLLSTHTGRDGAAISGRDASVLWRNAVFDQMWRSEVVARSLPDADIDGDGTSDLLFVSRSSGVSKTAQVIAASGRDGRKLWSSDLTVGDGFGTPNIDFPHLAGHILEKGKKPDVLVLYQQIRSNATLDSGPNRSRLARLSGSDGHVLWDEALDDYNYMQLGNQKIPFTTADLDGDGVNDIVFWLPTAQAGQQANMPSKRQAGAVAAEVAAALATRPLFELRAYSGRDGKLLWRRSGFFSDNGGLISTLGDIPAPVICQTNGGNPMVLVTDQGFVSNDPGSSGGKRAAPDGFRTEVLALDGRSGKPKWSWCGAPSRFTPLEHTGDWRTASPQLVRTAKGFAIAVSAFDRTLRDRHKPFSPFFPLSSSSQIVLLDLHGEVLQEIDNRSERMPASVGQRVWVHDLLGDGQDEMIWCDNRTVRAIRPGDKKILWESEEMPVFFCISDIQPAGKGYPATIVVVRGDRTVGLAGPTGKVRWRCDIVPGGSAAASGLLATDDPSGLPRIWTDNGYLAACYSTLPTDEHGHYLPSQSAPRKYDTALVDHRLLHPLPWNQPDGMQNFQEDWSGTWIVVMVVVIAVASIVGWWPGKMRRAAWLFGLWLIPSLTIMVVRLWLDARDFGPAEHYDWSRFWDFSIQDARSFMGILGAVVQVWWLVRIVWWCVRWIRARLSRARNAPA